MHLGKSYTLFEFVFWSRRNLYALLPCGVLPIFLYQFIGMKWLSIPLSIVVLLGTATSFIVGFKNVQTYNRAAEAQQIWTNILNGSRFFGVMSRDYPVRSSTGREMIQRHCAWLTALRYQLRAPRVWESMGKSSNAEYQKKHYQVPEWKMPLEQALARYLVDAEIKMLLQAENRATQILAQQSNAIKYYRARGEIDEAAYLELSRAIKGFFDQQGQAERIKDYPYPRQYAVVNKLFVRSFCVLLPFGVLTEFLKIKENVSGMMHDGVIWLVIPFSAIISWMYLVLEQVGESTENPFEGNANDVPITQICRKIERELMDIFGETSEVADSESKDFIVL
ncbi:bestrophin family protein [Burkholderia pseudomallei]|uniref:bestrophin family protein n=1 Tax=Burkholderia pseudomallei TaxID=28450 RepID=UPI0019402C87|nr:bestrophin family ion channel [Burkholderia pseudomallei]MBM5584965.1 multidrug transporter [Burkholderia pseudomallei]